MQQLRQRAGPSENHSHARVSSCLAASAPTNQHHDSRDAEQQLNNNHAKHHLRSHSYSFNPYVLASSLLQPVSLTRFLCSNCVSGQSPQKTTAMQECHPVRLQVPQQTSTTTRRTLSNSCTTTMQSTICACKCMCMAHVLCLRDV